jgi:hypothetical protein
MDLESRVASLQESRRLPDAKQLIKAVIAGTSDYEARIEDDRLIITSERFTGIHELGEEDRWRACPYKRKGKYQFTGRNDEFDIRFEFTNSNVDDIYQKLMEDTRSQESEASSETVRLAVDGGTVEEHTESSGSLFSRMLTWVRD